MSIKLLNRHHLEFLSLKGGYTGSSESTLIKMLHSWKSHVVAHLFLNGKIEKVLQNYSLPVVSVCTQLLSISSFHKKL